MEVLHDPPEPIRSGPVPSMLTERQRECGQRNDAAASGAFALGGEASRAAEAQVYGTAFAAKRSIDEQIVGRCVTNIGTFRILRRHLFMHVHCRRHSCHQSASQLDRGLYCSRCGVLETQRKSVRLFFTLCSLTYHAAGMYICTCCMYRSRAHEQCPPPTGPREQWARYGPALEQARRVHGGGLPLAPHAGGK